MIYPILKDLITKGAYEEEDMKGKLDVFFTFGRIELEQYQELMDLI